MSDRSRYAPLLRLGAAYVLGRVALYLILFPIHFAVSGLALAVVAVKAGSGDTDAWFWLAYAWIVLQTLAGFPLIVPNGLALAFLAIEATEGNTGWIFWTCFAWLAAVILVGGLSRRAAVYYRRRRRAAEGDAASGASPSFAWFVSSFGGTAASEAQADGPQPDVVLGEQAVVDLSDAAAEEPDDLVGELERLSALHAAGELSDEEFEQAKRRLLDE